MIVRRELPGDAGPVRALFSTVSSATFFDRLNADKAWLPELSFVATKGDDVVGHVAATRGQIGSAPTPALVPLSVSPAQRGRGVGQALMHAVLGAAETFDESLVGLVAMPPEYFSRFGFKPAEEFGIAAPVGGWQPSFLIRPLTGYTDSLTGTFAFPAAFGA